MTESRRRIAHVVTVPDSLVFLDKHIKAARDAGYEVDVFSGPATSDAAKRIGPTTGFRVIPLTRHLSPWRDLQALRVLRAAFKVTKPDIVDGHTPKAGFTAMLAGRLARVPVRVYHMHGLAFPTAHGWRRVAMRRMERASCRWSTIVVCVSPSLRDQAVAEGLVSADKARVVGSGSIAGVDARGLFDPARYPPEKTRSWREDHGIPPRAFVIGFLGRLAADKGIRELVEAFANMREDVHLVLVGPWDERDPIDDETRQRLENPRIHLCGPSSEPALALAAMDVVASPTHREGFGLALLEAGALGKAVVATRIPGCVDAVMDGKTGILVAPGDARALAQALELLVTDASLRKKLGEAARRRALEAFDPARLTSGLLELYEGQLTRAVS